MLRTDGSAASGACSCVRRGHLYRDTLGVVEGRPRGGHPRAVGALIGLAVSPAGSRGAGYCGSEQPCQALPVGEGHAAVGGEDLACLFD